MDTIALEVLVLMLIITGLAGVVWVTWRLIRPPDPEELYWRFIPHWTTDRLSRLHIIDPEMPELARKAAETLLHQARGKGVRE